MVVLPGSGSGWVSILGMLRLLFHPTGMCKMPGQGVLVGLAKSLEKLSSGFRINRAADDAAGLAISEGLRSQVGGNRQAVRNAQDGISVIQTAEGALNEVHSILQRMRVLAVQGANDSNDSKSRDNIKAELTQLRDELERIGEVTNFNGTKLLNGKASGNNAMKFQVGANGTNNDRIVVDLKDADVTAVSKFNIQGAKISNITSAKATLEADKEYAFNIEGKTIHLNMKANGATPAKLSEVLESALKNANVEGIISGARTKLEETITWKNDVDLTGKTFKLEIGNNTFKYEVGSGDTSKGSSVQAVMDGLMADIRKQGHQNDFKILADDAGKVTIEDLRGANAPVAKVKLSADVEAVDGIAANANILTKGDRIGSSTTKGFVFDVDDANKTIVMKRGDGGTIDIDKDHAITELNADAGTRGKANKAVNWTNKVYADAGKTTDYVTKDTDFLSVETHEKAQSLIDLLDAKINSVSTARANLGAIQNRFEHTIANLNVAVENLAASESRIRDTDMAQEMMQFTRNQILSQAGTSMLAQANQVPQGVLSLLR
nr:flagellin [Mobiluncus mulieris]